MLGQGWHCAPLGILFPTTLHSFCIPSVLPLADLLIVLRTYASRKAIPSCPQQMLEAMAKRSISFATNCEELQQELASGEGGYTRLQQELTSAESSEQQAAHEASKTIHDLEHKCEDQPFPARVASISRCQNLHTI